MLAGQNIPPTSLDAISIAVGPGSFTGLRVGVTCAKVLAWGTGAKIYGVDTLVSLAEKAAFAPENLLHTPYILSAGIDAQRREAAVRNFFIFRDEAGQPRIIPLEETFHLLPLAEWLSPDGEIFQKKSGIYCQNSLKDGIIKVSSLENLSEKDIPVYFTGPILARWKEKTDEQVRRCFLPEQAWFPDAADLAHWTARQGETADDPWRILPVYSRLSAAEEKLAAKSASKSAAAGAR